MVEYLVSVVVGWRRCLASLEQVWGSGGAGVENGRTPAPLQRVEVRFAVQVPTQKPHLRQAWVRLAPAEATTCAKNGWYLRRVMGFADIFAKKNVE